MIPVTQTKVVVNNSKGEEVIRGNCLAAVIASIMELPISEVPNVEVLYHIGSYWSEVIHTFLNSLGWELLSDDRYRVFHDGLWGTEPGDTTARSEALAECKDKYYLVSGNSPRGVRHICIYQNGNLVHDPHPTREGITHLDYFQTLEKQK